VEIEKENEIIFVSKEEKSVTSTDHTNIIVEVMNKMN
jgi:hypothetical protein